MWEFCSQLFVHYEVVCFFEAEFFVYFDGFFLFVCVKHQGLEALLFCKLFNEAKGFQAKALSLVP